eukprot:CAMPEP_0183722770 /NCGR_PEP_ID=MMETSP0737-20130205/14635_1 /TAXON_ID=385413 /ORGANISM="Thalassiosira miniscula, Strain CCMP1093" /LENGTH=545 /DNA_ID=CAMNT_0025953005 /DNA_START=142 /DNA_END=1779 /DNA_ORIENTATION=+
MATLLLTLVTLSPSPYSYGYSYIIPTNDDNDVPTSPTPNQYFPESELVLDMAILSHAVYKLRNRVQSCHEKYVNDNDNYNNGAEDDGEGGDDGEGSSNNGESSNTNSNTNSSNSDDDASSSSSSTDAKNIYQLLLPPGTECLHYSHDYSLGTQVLVVRSTIHNYVAVSYAGTDDWKTLTTDGDILTSDFGPNINGNDDDDQRNVTNKDSDASQASEDDRGEDGSSSSSNNNKGNNNYNNNDDDDIARLFHGVPEGVRVHRGFNSAVFDNDGFPTILDCVSKARLGGRCDDDGNESDTSSDNDSGSTDDPIDPTTTPYRLFTTGHSLGAADSVLLGAALHLAYPDETIKSINFGCPKVGNARWSFWMDSLQPDRGGQKSTTTEPSSSSFLRSPSSSSLSSLNGSEDSGESKKNGSFEIFRFVNKIDLVPRLPELMFTHAGHTLQMSIGGGIKAYYDHIGSEDLGYAGVPFGWEAAPYAFLPGALASHRSGHYVDYLTYYAPDKNQTILNASNATDAVYYYVHNFERVEKEYDSPPARREDVVTSIS